MFESANGSFDPAPSEMADEAKLLDIYKEAIPPEFDADLIALHKSMDFELRRLILNSGLRPEFSRHGMKGNQSRYLFENKVISLAEEHGLKAGTFKSGGGSWHIKISTKLAVITVHTIGDKDDKISKFARYKEKLASSNPSYLLSKNPQQYSSSYLSNPKINAPRQGLLLLDTDIGLPQIPPSGVYYDDRIYFAISVPRFFHERSDIHLIVPSCMYLGTLAEFNYLDVRDSTLVETEINLYTENTIQPKKIRLKKNDANEIIPKRPGKDQSREGEY